MAARKPATSAAAEAPAARDPRPLLARVVGQEPAVRVLQRALASDRAHHAYLFEGPEGVGRELAALGFAQALVCEVRKPGEAEACGVCSACVRTETVEGRSKHPDIVFLERGLYEPGLLGRKTPENQDLSVDQVRTLVLARAAFGPHEGKAKVFIVRRADELSTSAANALLKTLEEPLPRTFFVLMTSRRAELLPTVLSRTLPVRFRALSAAARKVLMGAAPGSDTEADAATKDNTGAAALGPQLWSAAAASDFNAALELSASMKKPRGELGEDLESAALWFAEKARTEVQSAPGTGLTSPIERTSLFCAIAHELVTAARRDIDGNAAPQLRMEQLTSELRRAFPR